jgi:hypothetical protein
VAIIGDPFTALITLVREAAQVAKARASELRAARVDPSVKFDATMLARVAETLLATVLLVEHSHWTAAAGTTRQLFELLLNLEHLANYVDREAGILRYMNFGELQQLRGRIEKLKFIREAGHILDETQGQGYVAQLKEDRFKPFIQRLDKETQAPVWATSWSGHKIYKLCTLSVHQIRTSQYNLLFVEWSELAHAAPGATMAPDKSEEDASRTHSEATLRGSELLYMSMGFFIELWDLLPGAPPENRHLVHAHWGPDSRTLYSQLTSPR